MLDMVVMVMAKMKLWPCIYNNIQYYRKNVIIIINNGII
jgi:hypothetical protein